MKNTILILTKTLSSNALKIALRLICYMRYEDNCLVKKNGKKVFQKDMQIEFDYSKPTMEKYLKELISNGVIAKQKCDLGDCWFFNPFIARKGKEISLETIKMFQKTKWNTQGICVDN